MPWKIQTASVNGWADIKVSDHGGPYVAQPYDSAEEAGREMELLAGIHADDHESYRIVPASTPADDELY